MTQKQIAYRSVISAMLVLLSGGLGAFVFAGGQDRAGTSAAPELAFMTPARIWKVEVLPAPSGPMRPKISPLLTSKLIPRTASVSPYFFQRFCTRMAAPEEGGHPEP